MRIFTMLACATGALLGLPAQAGAQIARLPPQVASGIVALGANLNPGLVRDTFGMFRPLMVPVEGIALTSDLRYGPDERNRLDVYAPTAQGGPRPVLVFVHGGGFVGGDKAIDPTFYANIGRFFAARGMVVVVPTYRLAPAHPWPAGTVDVAAAVAWAHDNAARFGGDGNRIVVSGQSAGATHVAAYLFDPKLGPKPGSGVVAGILGSGFYEMTEAQNSGGNRAYYGADSKLYAERSPVAHVEEAKLPLFLYTAEYDPPFLAAPTFRLAARLCERDGKCPEYFYARGHNHISEVAVIGTADTELGDAMADFIGALK